MINFKIDSSLLAKVKTLSASEKVTCIVWAEKFERLKHFLLKKGIEILDEYLFIKSFRVRATKQQLNYLASLAQVDYIFSLSTASMMMHVSKKILGCDVSHLSGSGINVGVIDTGIASHADFCLGENRIAFFKDFVGSKEKNYDDNGHGTFVSGVLAGNGYSSALKYAGIAPRARIYSLKALDRNGEAFSNKILDAMEWIFDNHKKENIRVVCMSFGSEPLGYNDPIMAGAEALWRDGVVVVSAAGNSGPEYQTIKSPGVSRRVITVGGIDDNRLGEDIYDRRLFEIAPFSSRGPAFRGFKPDLVAPAVDIVSCSKEGGYTMLSGTSVATPMIAGLCALLLEAKPRLSPDEVKSELLSLCSPITFNRNLEGFGIPRI